MCVSVSQGGTGNLSHVTPNTSLSVVQATPSRVLPSPTVNTREALSKHRPHPISPAHFHIHLASTQCGQAGTILVLSPDVIMDMFQAPTIPAAPFPNTLAYPGSEMEAEPAPPKHGTASSGLELRQLLLHLQRANMFLSCPAQHMELGEEEEEFSSFSLILQEEHRPPSQLLLPSSSFRMTKTEKTGGRVTPSVLLMIIFSSVLLYFLLNGSFLPCLSLVQCGSSCCSQNESSQSSG